MEPEKPVSCTRCHGVFYRDPTWVVLRRAVNSLPLGAVGRVVSYVKDCVGAPRRGTFRGHASQHPMQIRFESPATVLEAGSGDFPEGDPHEIRPADLIGYRRRPTGES